MTEKKINVFFDIDGTLAEWITVANFSDLFQKGYFRTLAPTTLIGYANRLADKNSDVDAYILSAYLPESYAFSEKNEWVDEHVPNFDKMHRIFVHDGVCKAEAIIEAMKRPLTENDVLIDDYTSNLTAWQAAGGKAIKWLNGINGLGGRFDGPRTGSIEELNRMIFA